MVHLAILNGFLSSAVTGSLSTQPQYFGPTMIDSDLSADWHCKTRHTSAEVKLYTKNCGCASPATSSCSFSCRTQSKALLVLKGTFDNKWLLCQLKKRLLGYYLLTTFFFTKKLLPVCRKSLLNKTLGDPPSSKSFGTYNVPVLILSPGWWSLF